MQISLYVYLVPNLLAGFSNVQCLRLQHRKINLLESKQPRNLNSTANQIQTTYTYTYIYTDIIYLYLSEILKEPSAEAHFLGGTVSGALGRIDVDFLQHFGDWRWSERTGPTSATAIIAGGLCCGGGGGRQRREASRVYCRDWEFANAIESE